ncbi:hypothetical protein LR48_Vigan11g111700 [Vigna angularis]|uniref:Aminotransferase-like plant mobile domain-containing protein n=1 Tax=Phaseolus angularis TaxID=3914 RepID=A0A0L9VT16_PHAAN|nr:hypothetical protein LR48_Vigan11g111700 [Vigna angularis]
MNRCCAGLKPGWTTLSSIGVLTVVVFFGPMASEQANWRLRISMESSSIVEMNRLVGDAHVERIRMTHFRWCLHIVEPLEVNLKLLKMMVQRWIEHDVSFIVSQELVPFSVLDVLMTIGLDIGGLEIPFDESVVEVVGDMFNPKTTTLKEAMDMFCLVVRDENIEAWAIERLSLHSHYSHRRFPRILRWFPYTATTKEIDNIFKTEDLNLEWYVSKEDCEVAEIRAAFHMDDGGMGEGSMLERSWVQERDDESSNDDTWLAGAEERMRKNNHDIMTLNAKIGVITRELIDIRQTTIFNEEFEFGHDEEGVGGAEEAPASRGDEEDVGGDDEQHGGPYNEEAGDEEAGDEEPPHEDDKLAASQNIKMKKHPRVCIEIDKLINITHF